MTHYPASSIAWPPNSKLNITALLPVAFAIVSWLLASRSSVGMLWCSAHFVLIP